MPNAAARRTKKATASTPETNGVNVVSTLAVDDYQVDELGDYEFTRQGAGRKREPSPFDNHVEEWAGKGPRRVRVSSEEEGKEVIKALQKACEYRERGLEKRIVEMEDGLAVVFQVNEAKAKRAPRKTRGESAATDGELVDAAETE